MQISDDLWSQLLALKANCESGQFASPILVWNSECFRCAERLDEVDLISEHVLISSIALPTCGLAESALLEDEIWFYSTPGCDPSILSCLKLYVPLCAASLFRPGKSFVMVHMAQSIDGNVAIESGRSQWIGNEQNLLHAHRLRALVDGVIVGGNTARQDHPGLNVRHVTGDDPARIILSDLFLDFPKLPIVEGMRTLSLRSTRLPENVEGITESDVIYHKPADGKFDADNLLNQLRAVGVFSILIEGGPITFRSFFETGTVDWLQVHVAPTIFGSGKSLITLPAIEAIDDAIKLRNPFYVNMGDAIMVTGQL